MNFSRKTPLVGIKGGWLLRLSPNPVSTLLRSLICGHSLAGIAGSNLERGMDVCL